MPVHGEDDLITGSTSTSSTLLRLAFTEALGIPTILTDVNVAVDQRLVEEGDGWRVAMHSLAFERSLSGSAARCVDGCRADRAVSLEVTTREVLRLHLERMSERAFMCGFALADDAFLFGNAAD